MHRRWTCHKVDSCSFLGRCHPLHKVFIENRDSQLPLFGCFASRTLYSSQRTESLHLEWRACDKRNTFLTYHASTGLRHRLVPSSRCTYWRGWNLVRLGTAQVLLIQTEDACSKTRSVDGENRPVQIDKRPTHSGDIRATPVL